MVYTPCSVPQHVALIAKLEVSSLSSRCHSPGPTCTPTPSRLLPSDSRTLSHHKDVCFNSTLAAAFLNYQQFRDSMQAAAFLNYQQFRDSLQAAVFLNCQLFRDSTVALNHFYFKICYNHQIFVCGHVLNNNNKG